MAIRKYIDRDGWYLYDYETVSIDHYRTGHISGEAYCGTCDGGRCDNCREIWRVVQMDETETCPAPHPVYWVNCESLEEAERVMAELEEKENS